MLNTARRLIVTIAALLAAPIGAAGAQEATRSAPPIAIQPARSISVLTSKTLPKQPGPSGAAAKGAIASPAPLPLLPKVSQRRLAPKPASETTWIAWAIDQMLGPPDSLRRRAVGQRPKQQVRLSPDGRFAVSAPNASRARSSVSPIVTGALPVRALNAFWRLGAPEGTSLPHYSRPDRARVLADLPLLELASRSYGEIVPPGGAVFERDPAWRVVEWARPSMNDALRDAAIATGFEAVTYRNITTGQLVVAIAGSRPTISLRSGDAAAESRREAYRDWWVNDIKHALIRAEPPPQYAVALSYIQDVMARADVRPDQVTCTGHSLGGGACAHAAAELGLAAVTINPISAGVRRIERADRIANYVVKGELARVIYGLRGLAPTGAIYLFGDGRADLDAAVKLLRFGPTRGAILYAARELIESLLDHGAEAAIDRICQDFGIARLR